MSQNVAHGCMEFNLACELAVFALLASSRPNASVVRVRPKFRVDSGVPHRRDRAPCQAHINTNAMVPVLAAGATSTASQRASNQ